MSKKPRKDERALDAYERRVNELQAEDAERRAPQAEKPGVEPPEPEPAAATATNSAPAGRRVTVAQFADEHGLSRHEAEWLLTKLGLRNDTHDGTTLYDVAAIDRVLAAEDTAKVAEAAELLGRFADDGLARRIAQEACEDLRAQWLSAADLRVEVDAVKRALAVKFAKMHQTQTAQRQGGIWAELEAIDGFEQALLAAIETHRQQKPEGDTDDV